MFVLARKLEINRAIHYGPMHRPLGHIHRKYTKQSVSSEFLSYTKLKRDSTYDYMDFVPGLTLQQHTRASRAVTSHESTPIQRNSLRNTLMVCRDAYMTCAQAVC